jgi:hypothetical protein
MLALFLVTYPETLPFTEIANYSTPIALLLSLAELQLRKISSMCYPSSSRVPIWSTDREDMMIFVLWP